MCGRNYKCVPRECNACLKLQEVAFKALKSGKEAWFSFPLERALIVELTQTASNCKVNRCMDKRNNS